MKRVSGAERWSSPDALSPKQPSHGDGVQIVQEPHPFPERSSDIPRLSLFSTQHFLNAPQMPRSRVFLPPPPPHREALSPAQSWEAHQHRLTELRKFLSSPALLGRSVVSNFFDRPSDTDDLLFNIEEDPVLQQDKHYVSA